MRKSLYNTYTLIHSKRLRTNLDVLSRNINPEISKMAVVKANAYGHGAVKVAHILKDKVEWFGVANVREGIELRKSDIKNPILVLGVPDSHNKRYYREYNLTAVISAFEHFNMLPKGTEYHLNFDTGMGRLGFYEDQVDRVLEAVSNHQDLHLRGLMSHFATADEPGSKKVQNQWKAFERIQRYFPNDITFHIANTGGALFYDRNLFDMVRFGIGIYGYPPGGVVIEGLKPAMVWKSYLAQVKPINEGMSVSYLARWQAPHDGYLGVIPVGYGDGYPRNISGKAKVTIEGKDYPQVGIVTMDYIMIFLDQDQPPVDSEVVLMGNAGNTATEIANMMGTINYEILCRLTDRVERRYV